MSKNRARYLKALKNLRRVPELAACMRASRDWRWMIPAYLGIREASFPATFHTRDGNAITIETFHDLVTVWVIFFRQEYTVRETDRCIVDVGANIGAFTLYASRCAPRARIIALEPFPETRTKLENNLKLNALDDRVTCRPYGLAAVESTRRMSGEGPSQSRGLLDSDAGDGIEVQTVSLATLLGETTGDVDLLKVDIEGGEHEAFRDLDADTIRRVQRISLEYHPNGSKETLFAELTTAGFRLVRDEIAGVNSGVAEFQRN